MIFNRYAYYRNGRCATLWLAMLSAYFASDITMGITIETVPVGHPGNPPDQDFGGGPHGAVNHAFRIGRFEVTNDQYVTFLNAVNPDGTSSVIDGPCCNTSIRFDTGASNGQKFSVVPGANLQPVTLVSQLDAMRFANWLHNGQGGPGTTEDGAYALLGGNPSADMITRKPGAKWFVPTEDEWYKAAYYQPASAGGDSDGYWTYPTGSNVAPNSASPPGSSAPTPSNTANVFRNDGIANGYDDGYAMAGSTTLPVDSGGSAEIRKILSNVGAYSFTKNFFGTFDQGGNVWEWTETWAPSLNDPACNNKNCYATLRGASASNPYTETSAAFSARSSWPNNSSHLWNVGFRVAAAAEVPEPQSLTLLALAATLGGWRFLRRRSDE